MSKIPKPGNLTCMRIVSLRGVIKEKTHKLDISKKGECIKESN